MKKYSIDAQLRPGSLTSGDIAQYRKWLQTLNDLEHEGEETRSQRMKRHLLNAMEQDCTPLQQKYLQEYFFEGKTQTQIAMKYGVNKSTVSRSIHAGLKRLQRCLKYTL